MRLALHVIGIKDNHIDPFGKKCGERSDEVSFRRNTRKIVHDNILGGGNVLDAEPNGFLHHESTLETAKGAAGVGDAGTFSGP